MDLFLSIVSFIIVMIVWLQLSAMSFSYNFLAAFIGSVAFLYLAVVTRFLFPIERILLFYFAKVGRRKQEIENSSTSPAIKHRFDDEITRKMRELTGHIVRDFILEWYNTVSGDVHFVQEAFELFEHIFTSSRQRVSRVDRQILLGTMLAFLSRHLSCYQRSEIYASAMTKEAQRKKQLVILSYEKLLGHLAMSDLPNSEMDHLRSLTTVLLKALLPRDYRLTGTSLYLVRELISRNVLLPLVDMLSDPDWLNGMVTRVLEEDSEGGDNDSTEGSSDSSDTEDLTDLDDGAVEPLPITAENDRVSNSKGRNNERDGGNTRVSFSVASNMDELLLDIDYQPEAPSFDDAIVTSSGESIANTAPTASPRGLGTDDGEAGVESASDPIPAPPVLPIPSTHPDQTPNIILTTSEANDGIPAVTTSRPGNRRSPLQEDRFFQQVRIPATVTTEEAFEGGGKYTLYKIEYCAPPLPAHRRSRFPFRGQDPSDPEPPGEEVELQHYQVQRRFREFLTLQERLNERQLIRRLLRDVKAPSRMFMPIGNMDKEYIEKRRKFLQAYLRELCSFPDVSRSSEMREFLAYNSDPRIAFVRRPSDFIPRFDKMLRTAVQDLIGSASVKLVNTFSRHDDVTTLSVAEERQMSSSDFKESKSMPILSSHPPSSTPTEPLGESPPLHSGKSMNPVARLKNMVMGKRHSLFEEGLRDYTAFSGPQNPNDLTFSMGWRDPLTLLSGRESHSPLSGRRGQGDGCDGDGDMREQPVGGSGQDLVTGRIFRLTKQIWPVSPGVNTMLFLTLARYVKTYIDFNVASLTQKDKWLQYLKSFQDALWPGGEWGGKGGDKVKKKQRLKEDARCALEDAFPDALRYVVGHHGYLGGVDRLLASFQDPVVNRHLVYHLVDVMIRLLLPDLHIVISQSSNVSL